MHAAQHTPGSSECGGHISVSELLAPEEAEERDHVDAALSHPVYRPRAETREEQAGEELTASELARRLYSHEGYTARDVCAVLTKRGEYHESVARAYCRHFDFAAMQIDQALRVFLRQFWLEGETHQKARVLEFFADRYHECNPTALPSPDACYTLTFSLVLLNTDLHSAGVQHKMSLQAFVANHRGLNSGKDFPADLLTQLYYSIKRRQIEMPLAMVEDPGNLGKIRSGRRLADKLPRRLSRISLTSELSDRTSRSIGAVSLPTHCHRSWSMDTVNDVAVLGEVRRRGPLVRKMVMSGEGRRASSRSWVACSAELVGSTLYFYKPGAGRKVDMAVVVRHGLATVGAAKRAHVLQLQTHEHAVLYLQAEADPDMRGWIEALNLAAASHAAPPLPAPVASQQTVFRWPILPKAHSTRTLEEQLQLCRDKLEGCQEDLRAHAAVRETEAVSGVRRMYWERKLDYLKYEVERYSTYINVLDRHMGGPPRLANTASDCNMP